MVYRLVCGGWLHFWFTKYGRESPLRELWEYVNTLLEFLE